jgi:hypothetical protein
MVATLGSTEHEALQRRQRLAELANTRKAVGWRTATRLAFERSRV